jgi:hypothetical protein
VTSLDSTRGETAHLLPQFLPDGRHFFYVARGPAGGAFGADLNYRLKALPQSLQVPKGPMPRSGRMPKAPKPRFR